MHVYLIVNEANGKYYVGKTIRRNLRSYFKQCIADALSGRTDKPYLYNAIRKHGPDKFRVHSLIGTLLTDEQLCHWERELIMRFRSYDPNVGYNLTFGGQSGVPTEATRVKLRAWQLGRKFTQEHKDKIAAKATGKKCSEESRRKRSEAQKKWIVANEKNKEKHQRSLKALKVYWTAERRKQHGDFIRRVRAARFWSTNPRSKTSGN